VGNGKEIFKLTTVLMSIPSNLCVNHTAENEMAAGGAVPSAKMAPVFYYISLHQRVDVNLPYLPSSWYLSEWVDLYRANNFQLIDPVVLTAFKRTSPFA